jgi:hypothetical protein
MKVRIDQVLALATPAAPNNPVANFLNDRNQHKTTAETSLKT